jgi:hypothetical protein
MMDVWSDPAIVAAVEAGGGANLLCPVCRGGRSREHSLSVFLDMGRAVAVCFRASCPSAVHKTFLTPEQAKRWLTEPTPRKPRPYRGALWTMDSYEAQSLEHFRLGAGWFSGMLRATEHGQLAMRVQGPNRQDRGWMMREWPGTKPRKRSAWPVEWPWQAWYPQEPGMIPGCVIVEDQLSAMRAAQQGYVAVALLGTNLNDEKAAELRAVSSRWMLALDGDAFSKVISYSRQYSWLRPVRLERDLKDCTDSEIQERLQNVRD